MLDIFKDKKFLKECAITLIVGLLINAACFFMCSIIGHAETINSVLPYLCQNDNSFYSEAGVSNALSVINDKYPNSDIYNKKFFVCYGVYNIWYTYSDYVEVPAYYVYTCPDNLILPTTWSGTSTFDNFQFNDSSCYIDVSLGNYPRYIVAPRSTSVDSSGFYCNEFNGGTVRLFGTVTTHNINNKYFDLTVPGINYPVYTTSQFSTVDRNANQGYILAFADTIVSPGDFTDLPPLDDVLNNISNSYTPHSNNTPPNYDNTLSDGENISNSVDSLADNLNNAINNLGSNIKSWFDNLQQKLTDTTNAILGGIHDGFATINQNFKDFFGAKLDAILDKINYITQPLDSSSILSVLENEDFYSDFTDLKDFHNELDTLFNIQEPDEFVLAIHFENFNDDFYSNVGTQEIDISFLHDSTLFRSFCWVVVCSGLTFIVASGIPSMLRGDKGD